MDLLVEKVDMGREGGLVGNDGGLRMRGEWKIVDRIGVVRGWVYAMEGYKWVVVWGEWAFALLSRQIVVNSW